MKFFETLNDDVDKGKLAEKVHHAVAVGYANGGIAPSTIDAMQKVVDEMRAAEKNDPVTGWEEKTVPLTIGDGWEQIGHATVRVDRQGRCVILVLGDMSKLWVDKLTYVKVSSNPIG